MRVYRLTDLPDWIMYRQRNRNGRMAGEPRVVIDPGSGCWRWLGIHNADGYGMVSVPGDRNRRVHRVVYVALVGPIPDGLELDHVKARGCVHRDCLRPDHLEPVTRRENTMRGDSPTARYATAAKCVNGHEFTEANTGIRANGSRDCLTCSREANRRWYRVRPDARRERERLYREANREVLRERGKVQDRRRRERKRAARIEPAEVD